VRLHPADHARPWRSSIVPLLVLAGGLLVGGCGSSNSTSSSASTPATAPAATAPATTAQSTTSTSSTPTSSSAPASTLGLAANPEGQLKYSTTSLAAKAGKVTIDFTNMSSLSHNMTIESSSGAVVGATPSFQGGSKTLALDLKPGTYKFYCSVPGHRQAGMEGTLTVK
jgi:plastocyanin